LEQRPVFPASRLPSSLDDGERIKEEMVREHDPVRLEIFRNLFSSIAEEMGVTLLRSAFSPNIKERRDFSCAVFDGKGRMIEQAAHIPVHLGSMPLSAQKALSRIDELKPGDVIILNDPFSGGTHLPDITVISPVFLDGKLPFLVANRAHHSDVGGISPGSMSPSTEMIQKGIRIPPVKLLKEGVLDEEILSLILANVRTPDEREGDLRAQIAAEDCGSAFGSPASGLSRQNPRRKPPMAPSAAQAKRGRIF